DISIFDPPNPSSKLALTSLFFAFILLYSWAITHKSILLIYFLSIFLFFMP
ncbi:unnamed protein product, partial [Arabidopsis halleri]